MLAKSLTFLIASAGALLAQTARDNVLFILADDIGVDKVGIYREGPNPPPTPNLDALAKRGVLFRNAWANPICSPTRACINSGRYSFRTRVGYAIPRRNTGVLSLGEFTVPEVLDSARSGYAHATIGKWHLGDQFDVDDPNRAGWSHFAGLIPGTVGSYYGWQRTVNGFKTVTRAYATTQMVDDALAWIKKQTKPWVCFLTLNAPHTPHHAPPAHLHTQDLVGKHPWQDPVPFFAAMVQAMDHEIGRLLKDVDLARTNVVFMGDNGTNSIVAESPFEPTHAKATPYEGGCNVPLLVAGPAVSMPGREVGALVGAVDIYSTVLDLAGVDASLHVPKWIPLDSVSFAPYLRDPKQAPLRETVFAEMFSGDDWVTMTTTGFATIRNDRYKLIRRYHADRRPVDEFYDLVNDPFERDNLLPIKADRDQKHNYLALGDELNRLRRPTRGFLPFGDGCRGSQGKLELRATGQPEVGLGYRIDLKGAARLSPALLFIGGSGQDWNGLGLPFDLAAIGASKCRIWCSGEFQLGTVTDDEGVCSVALNLPNLPGLIGRSIFHMWWNIDRKAPNNVFGVTTSNATVVRVGAQPSPR